MMISRVGIVVEAWMTNPPKPIGFHIVLEGRAIGILTYENVKQAIDQYETMVRESRT